MRDEPVQLIGVVSDIHGNLPALEAVLADMPSVDRIINSGDIVGYGPWPAKCVTRIRHRRSHSVMGNHDKRLLEDEGRDEGDIYAAKVIGDDQKAWIQSLPDQRLLFDERVKLVHGHPTERFNYTYQPEFDKSLLDEEDVLVLGHTHKQGAARTKDGRLIINPGSVGQPRDRDARAAYATIDLNDLTFSFERAPYDIDRVAERISKTEIKERTGTRLYQGR